MTDLEIAPGSIDLLSDYVEQKDWCKEARWSIRTDNRKNELGLGPTRTYIGRRVLYSRENIRRWLTAQEKAKSPRRMRKITTRTGKRAKGRVA